MESKDRIPFYIGQKVVSLVDGYVYKKGDETWIRGCHWSGCVWLVDVGIVSPVSKGGPFYPQASVFAPIQHQYTDISKEILEKFPVTEETPDKIIVPEKVNN